MRFKLLALGSLLAGTTLSAHATYTTVDYTGTVTLVHAATSGPAGPADILVGTPVYFSATFDPANAVNRGATINNIDGLTGLPMSLPNIKTISIFDDPAASYTITIGSHVFTSADDDEGGHDYGVGAGHFPLVVYDGDKLLGIEAESDVDGFTFGSSPGAFLLQESRHVGYGYFDADGDYGFRVDALDDAINDSRAAAIALAAVPEPSSWAMLAAGLGGIVWSKRRNARPAALAA